MDSFPIFFYNEAGEPLGSADTLAGAVELFRQDFKKKGNRTDEEWEKIKPAILLMIQLNLPIGTELI